MSESTLRQATSLLRNTTSRTWRLIDGFEGSGDDISMSRDNWNEENLEYAVVMIATGGQFDLSVRLADGVGHSGGVDQTPPAMLAEADAIVPDGGAALVRLRPTPAVTTPPGVPGVPGWQVLTRATPRGGAYPSATWQIGVFMRIVPGSGDQTGDCPPRPEWPYPDASIVGAPGAIGVMRGARR